MPKVTVRCNAEPDCRQLRCLYALPIRTRHYQRLGIKGETPQSRLEGLRTLSGLAANSSMAGRRRRPGASARARCPGLRGTVRRGSRQASGAGVRRRPVALDRDLVAASLHGAKRQAGVEDGGAEETLRELAVHLRDEELNVHVVLLSQAGWADAVCVGCLDGAAVRPQAGHLAPARSERAKNRQVDRTSACGTLGGQPTTTGYGLLKAGTPCRRCDSATGVRRWRCRRDEPHGGRIADGVVQAEDFRTGRWFVCVARMRCQLCANRGKASPDAGNGVRQGSFPASGRHATRKWVRCAVADLAQPRAGGDGGGVRRVGGRRGLRESTGGTPSRRRFRASRGDRQNSCSVLESESGVGVSCRGPCRDSPGVSCRATDRRAEQKKMKKNSKHDGEEQLPGAGAARGDRAVRRDKERADGTPLSADEVAGIGAGAVGSGANYADTVGILEKPNPHGFFAEKANDLFDKFGGKDAKLIGGGNEQNGPDRLVDGVQIQSKYCKTGADCVSECFKDGNFRYFNADNSPMQIEVPSDMYEAAVKAMEARIERGQVKGVSDPAKATEIVRKGNFTYAQAKNIARFGTVESLTYDAVNGVKLAGQAMGISAAVSFAVSIWNGEELDVALKQACKTGIKVGGIAWIGSIAAAQLGRTGIEQALRGSTDWLVSQMSFKAAAWIVNGMRSGSAIYGVAATNHLSKLLRGNVVTAIATTAVLSSMDFVRMFNGKMSGAQLFKNVTVTASGVAGGTAGWFGGAAAGAAIGSLAPGPGTAIGAFIGGLLGSLGVGAAASKTAAVVLDGFIEDDAKEMLAIVKKIYGALCVEYLLTREEAEAVLGDFQALDLPDVLRDMYAADDQRGYARGVLEPLVEERVRARMRVALPSSEDLSRGTGRVLEELLGDAA